MYILGIIYLPVYTRNPPTMETLRALKCRLPPSWDGESSDDGWYRLVGGVTLKSNLFLFTNIDPLKHAGQRFPLTPENNTFSDRLPWSSQQLSCSMVYNTKRHTWCRIDGNDKESYPIKLKEFKKTIHKVKIPYS